MNSATSASVPRRSYGRWLLIGVGLCLAPFLVLAVIVASYITLDRDAAALRRHVMAASDADWHTKVQMNLGRATINAVSFGLGFVPEQKVADVRQGLTAVTRASVGVYEHAEGNPGGSREKLLKSTDGAMQKRGWSRLLGVVEQNEMVLIYVPQAVHADETMKVCLAVITGNELVVVSAEVDAVALTELIEHHTSGDLKKQLRLAAFSL